MNGDDVPFAYILRDPVWFWQVFGTYEGDPIRFDDWQVAHLHDDAKFRAREKAPQIGFSWLCAAEAVWDSMLHLDSTTGFVSVDQREASEKVLYGKKLWAELPEPLQAWIPMVKDSTEELWFGDTARPSRVMSIPATAALRGRKMSVYLDEVDFYRDGGRDAFRAGMGRVTRGGRLTLGSTCFGADTQLDRVMQGDERNFSRGVLPYTVAENPDVIASVKIAQQELDEGDFAEEYGCVRGGSVGDTFSAELLRQSMHDLGDLTLTFDDKGEIETNDLPDKQPILVGYDVAGGTGRHPAMLNVLVQDGDRVWRQRCVIEVRDLTLPQQEALLRQLLKDRSNAVLVVDATSIGLQISQSLEAEFGHRVVIMKPGSRPPDLEPQDRTQMTLELKRVLEAGDVELLPDREQTLQIKRTRIVNHKVEQPGSAKKTHYDRYWSTAYAVYGIRNSRRESVYERHGLIIIGGEYNTDKWGRRRPLVGAGEGTR